MLQTFLQWLQKSLTKQIVLYYLFPAGFFPLKQPNWSDSFNLGSLLLRDNTFVFVERIGRLFSFFKVSYGRTENHR